MYLELPTESEYNLGNKGSFNSFFFNISKPFKYSKIIIQIRGTQDLTFRRLSCVL